MKERKFISAEDAEAEFPGCIDVVASYFDGPADEIEEWGLYVEDGKLRWNTEYWFKGDDAEWVVFSGTAGNVLGAWVFLDYGQGECTVQPRKSEILEWDERFGRPHIKEW